VAIPRAKTELETIITYGVDRKNRIVEFGVPVDGFEENPSVFTQASVATCVRAIRTMVHDAPNKPVHIYMDSYGGDPYTMMYLKDVILTSPCQFKFYGGGAIMSAATWIMAVCDERYLYEDATIMVHTGSEEHSDRWNDYQITAKESERLMDRLFDIYEENSLMPKSFWQDVCQRDLYLTAQETVHLGLADSIIKQRGRKNLRRKRIKHLSSPNKRALNALVKRVYERIEVNPPGADIQINMPPKEKAEDEVIVDNTPMEDVEEKLLEIFKEDVDKKD